MEVVARQRHQMIAGIFVVVLGYRISAPRPTKRGPLVNAVCLLNHTMDCQLTRHYCG